MSEDAKWILGIGLPVITLLVGALWKLLRDQIDSQGKTIWDQIGRSPKEGMRERVHATAGESHGHGLEIRELQRRVEALDRKVFNGHES